MFNREKPIKEIFTIEAFQSLANWFLDQLIDKVAVVNAHRQKASLVVLDQISEEQKREFVRACSQDIFDQLQDIKLDPAQPRDIIRINVSEIASYAEKAGFPALCIPPETFIKPIAFISASGRITFDDGRDVGDIYDPEKSIQYKSNHLKEVNVEELAVHTTLKNGH